MINLKRSFKSNWLVKFGYEFLGNYPSPASLSYFWNFGVLAAVCLVVQLVTGIILTMHYVPNDALAFLSVEHIMRDVNYGWLMRYVHANGASMFFFVVYIHILRGLYFGSFAYPRERLWEVGVVILLIMVATAFMGYVLPWGQMSFWAATVITNLASAIPFIGKDIVFWLWGGFAVGGATLNRFYSFHYLLPFIIVALVLIHLIYLHESGSSNPLGLDDNSKLDKIPFTPYYTIKDLYGVILFFIFFLSFVFFDPNYLGHSDNYIPANPLDTPTHIVPEWYFLPYYAVLRSVPDKLGGVCLMLLIFVFLYGIANTLSLYVRSGRFKPLYKVSFWFFAFLSLVLGWLGGQPIETPYYEFGQLSTLLIFVYFFLISLLVEIEYVFQAPKI